MEGKFVTLLILFIKFLIVIISLILK